MNKRELLKKIAEVNYVPFSSPMDNALMYVNKIVEVIKEELEKGGEVRILEFGTFKVTDVKATSGHNLVTQEIMKIPASRRVRFKASKHFLTNERRKAVGRYEVS